MELFGCQSTHAPTGIKLLPASARIRSELGEDAVHDGAFLALEGRGQLVQQRRLFIAEMSAALSVPIGYPDAAAIATAYRFKRIGGREKLNVAPYCALVDAEL